MFEFLGKLHPLLVHLPIGFLVLLGGLEWLALNPNRKDLVPATRVILLLTLPVTFASVICGWLLAGHGGYDPGTLFWHRWLGTALGVVAGALWIIRQRGWMRLYRRALCLSLVLLIVASHFGGTLTHGSGFLAWPDAKPNPTPPTEERLLATPLYAGVVRPLLNQYCVNCHGENKSKGGLRLDRVEGLQKGGDSGPLFEPSGAEHSLLGKRIHLPEDDEDHMPPGGKPQPTAAQIRVLDWWLNSGTPTDETSIKQLKPAPEVLLALKDVMPRLAATPRK